MSSYRQEQISSQLKREISELIRKNLAEKFGLVTLTDIEVTADFKEAKVYISAYNKENEDIILTALTKEATKIQHILGRKLKIKFTPKLKFILDRYQKKIDRIDKLLKEINNES